MSEQKTQYAVASQDAVPPAPTSALLSPRTRVARARLQFRQTAHKFWLLEASASLLSLVIFTTIIAVLVVYDDRIYGDASTINSNLSKRPDLFPALAFLSAIMRATMLLPVATAIGQLKWSWFRSARRLIDIERFDEAARGILGSAKLMFYLRFRNIAAVGAALTILALPLDAVIQSAIKLPLATTPVSRLDPVSRNISGYKTDVFVERATSYKAFQTMTAGNDTWPETPMINAVMFGQGNTNGLNDFLKSTTMVNCPTGYCEFDNAQTLSIGWQCTNRSDIQYQPSVVNDDGVPTAPYQWLPGVPDFKFYLEGNVYAKQQRIAAQSYKEWPAEEDFPTYEKDIFGINHGPLIVRTVMALNLGNGSDDESLKDSNGTYAIECGLFWEIKTTQLYVDVSDPITDGDLSSRDTDITWHTTSKNGEDGVAWLLTPEECIAENKTVPVSDSAYYYDNCIHLVGQKAADGLQNMLTDYYYGLTGYLFLSKQFPNGTYQWTERNLFAINMERMTWNKSREEAWSHITDMWSDIAFTTSYIVRQTASVLSERPNAKLWIKGKASVLVFYYSVDWPRLGIPAFVVLCCTLFVLYAAIVTRKEYRWRRSALPLLFHGLEDRERYAQGDVRDFSVMQGVAKSIRVRLTENVDENGARLTTEH